MHTVQGGNTSGSVKASNTAADIHSSASLRKSGNSVAASDSKSVAGSASASDSDDSSSDSAGSEP